MFGNGGNWAYGPNVGSLRVRMPWNDSLLQDFDDYRFPYGVIDSCAFMDYLQHFDMFRVTQLDEGHIVMESFKREAEIYAVGKSAELVPGGVRVQMAGHGDLQQLAEELATLPVIMGISYGALCKEVLFKGNVEDYAFLNIDDAGNQYSSGIEEGLLNVGILDNKAQAPVLDCAFMPKEGKDDNLSAFAADSSPGRDSVRNSVVDHTGYE